MKKIDTIKSLIFSRDVDDLKKSLEYLNQDGYFSNSKDFSDYEEAKLCMVRVANFVWYPYDSTYECDGDSHVFSYFIPKCKVVFEEQSSKKFRPYKCLSELPFGIGDSIAIRVKEDPSDTMYAVVTEIVCTESRIDYLSFGTTLNRFSPKHYFDGYEFLLNDEWVPFGVKE